MKEKMWWYTSAILEKIERDLKRQTESTVVSLHTALNGILFGFVWAGRENGIKQAIDKWLITQEELEKIIQEQSAIYVTKNITNLENISEVDPVAYITRRSPAMVHTASKPDNDLPEVFAYVIKHKLVDENMLQKIAKQLDHEDTLESFVNSYYREDFIETIIEKYIETNNKK